MVNKILSTFIMLCGLFSWQMLMFAITADGEEQKLLLMNKTIAIETKKDYPIADFTFSFADINKDNKNEIIVSGNGYIRIFEWNGKMSEPKWKSPKYSYPLRFTNATFSKISHLVPVAYYVDEHLITDYLYFGYTTAKSSDIYKVIWKKNKYELEKVSASPFNWFDLTGTCGDGSSVIIGSKQHDKGNYVVAYKWKGESLVEKWQGAPGTEVIASGELLGNANKFATAILIGDKENIGILSCGADAVEWKKVDKDSGAINLWQNNRIGYGRGIMGITKKSSTGELWTIQYPQTESENYAKLYVSQFDGEKYSPFSRVIFKGIDSDMIFKIIIVDIDNDGVGEILGVEEKIRKSIPRKHQPGDTGEEGDTLLITSNLFFAKWNSKEYEIKWHRRAIDERVTSLAVGDVTGDGKKEILVTDENGYLYVFDMPIDK